MAIPTNYVEVDNNLLKNSHEDIYDEFVWVANIGPSNRVYNEILLIVSYKYKNNEFLWWQDITSNV